jgi:hypothetical protein
MKRNPALFRYLGVIKSRGVFINIRLHLGSPLYNGIIALFVLSAMLQSLDAETLTDSEDARLTQLQIDALRTPNDTHPLLVSSPGESPFTVLVKQMTAAVIDELNTNAVVVDFQAAEEIAKLIQKGAANIIASGASQNAIENAEARMKDFAKSMLADGDHVVGSKSAVAPKNGTEIVEIHRNAFYMVIHSFCPCWPFCE